MLGSWLGKSERSDCHPTIDLETVGAKGSLEGFWRKPSREGLFASRAALVVRADCHPTIDFVRTLF